MSLRLITGAFSRQLADEAFSAILTAVSSGSEATWVVPDNATATQFTRRIADKNCVLGIRIVTADRLLQSLWDRYGDGRQLVGETSRSAMLTRLLEVRRDRVPDALFRSRHVLSALRVLASQPRHVVARPAVHGAADVFADVLQAYHRELDAIELVEPIDAAIALRNRIPFLGTFVFGPFGELTSTQEALLESLAILSDVSTLHVWDRDIVATRAIDQFVDRLSFLASSHQTYQEPQGEKRELPSVVRSIGGGSPGAFSVEGAIEFGEASGDSAEAMLVAQIVEGEISRGREPGDIYISCRDLGQKHKAIARALEAFDIKYEVDVAIPLRNTEFGSAYLSLFGIHSDSSLLAVSRFLQSRFSTLTREKAHLIDKRLRSGALMEPAKFRAFISGGSREIQELLGMVETACAFEVGPEWATHMIAVASRMLALSATQGRNTGLLREDAAAHSAVSHALSEAVEASRGISVAVFLESLGEARVATGAVHLDDSVKLVEFRRLRSYECPVLILSGQNADQSDVVSLGGFEDTLRARLGYPPRVDVRAQSDYDTFVVLSGVSEKLILTRAARDAEGTDNRPGYLWEEIRSRYDWSDESSRPKLHTLSLSDIEMAAPTMDASRRPLRAAARGGELVAETVIRGQLSDQALGVRLVEDPVSITAIEKYLQCPYQWFVEKVLSPRELDSDKGARTRGSIIHAVLQRVVEYARDKTPQKRVCEDNIDLMWTYAKSCIDAVLEEEGSREVDMHSLLERRAVQSAVLQSLKLDTMLPPGFFPHKTEWEFGRDEPVVLGGAQVVGVMDRVDISGSHVAVIDYKSGTGSLTNVVPQEWNIQYLAYGVIASRTLNLPIGLAGYRFLSSGKFSGIGDESVFEGDRQLSKKQRLSSEAIEAAILNLESRVALAYRGMREMKIEPNPATGACKYCAASTFCARRIT